MLKSTVPSTMEESRLIQFIHQEKDSLKMLRVLCFSLVFLVFIVGSKSMAMEGEASCSMEDTLQITGSIGGVFDCSSRKGKEQKIAMELALQDFYLSTCSKLLSNIRDSYGSSALAVSAGILDFLPFSIHF